MPLNSGSKRPASRACNGPARSAIHDASSAGSAHVAILGPPVNDGARMQTPSWPKGLFHAKINSDQKDSEHSFFQKVQDPTKAQQYADRFARLKWPALLERYAR